MWTFHRTCVLLLFALLTLLLSLQIGEMWHVGHLGYNGALRSSIARNYHRYSIKKTKLAPIPSPGRIDESEFEIRFNHPPISGLLVAGAYAIFGEHPWAAKLPFILFTLLGAFFFYQIGRILWGREFGLWALFLYTIAPLVGIYGPMANYESLIVSVMFGSFYSYLKWSETKQARYLWLSLMLCTLGFWTDWPAWIFAFFIFVYALIREGKQRSLTTWESIRFPTYYALWVCLQVIIFVYYYAVILEVNRAKIEQLFKFRTKSRTGLSKTLEVILGRTEQLMIPLVAYIALVTLVSLILYTLWKKAAHQKSPTLVLAFLLCVWTPGLIYSIVFKGQFFIHCFSAYYSMPFAVFAAAGFLGWTTRYIKTHSSWSSRLYVTAMVVALGWVGISTTLEGKYTHGSPYEGKKKVIWKPFVLHNWLKTHSRDTQSILFTPSAPNKGRIVDYYLDRKQKNVYSWRQFTKHLDKGSFPHGVVSGRALWRTGLYTQMKQMGFTIFDKYVIFHPNDRQKRIQYIQAIEQPFDWFHRYFVSMTVPPHRWHHSKIFAARYELQYRKTLSAQHKTLSFKSKTSSPFEQAMLYNLMLWKKKSPGDPQMRMLEQSFLTRYDLVQASLSPYLEWKGFYNSKDPHGRTLLHFLFQVKKPFKGYKVIHNTLKHINSGKTYTPKWNAPRVYGLSWKQHEYFEVKRIIPQHFKKGRYYLQTMQKGSKPEPYHSPTFLHAPAPFMKLHKRI